MNVLIFSLAYDPFVGGAEVAIKQITELLPAHDWTMITANLDGRQPAEETIGRIKVYRVGRGRLGKYLFPVLAYRQARRLAADKKFNLTWAMMANQAGLAALFFKLKFSGIKYLLTLQEGDSELDIWLRTWFMRPFYKMIYRRADAIQAISTYLADRAKKLGATCRIEVVRNGINLSAALEANKTFQTRSSTDIKTIITVSRLVNKNGLKYLIEAFAKLLPQTKQAAQLQIVGVGSLREELERLACDLKIADKVKFLGEVPNSEVYKLLAQADVFVRPSLSEGLGNAFLEAMAVGLPTVGTPVGGIKDFLMDNTGWLVPVKDSDKLAETLAYILNPENQERVKAISLTGSAVAQNYDWQKISQEMNTIFVQTENQPKSILIATGIFPPEIGGPATMIGHLAEALAEAGFRISVLTYTAAAIQARPSSKLERLVTVTKGQWSSRLQYLWQMYKLSKQAGLIYVTDIYSVGYFAWLIKKLMGKKYVVRFAGDAAWETATGNGWTTDYITDFERNKYDEKIEKLKARRRKILRSADAVVVVSNFMADLAELIGVDRAKIRTIYNSIDFMPVAGDAAAAGLPSDGKIIMTACRLVRWKGVDGLIKILPAVNALVGATYLAVLGDGPEMSNLQLLTAELNVTDKVIFLGRISHDSVLGYFKCADVFCLNTNYEGLSHTLLEAMKAGAPIVATSVGGNPEVIEDGVSGLLVDYNNQEQLTAAIIEILRRPDWAEQLVSAATARLTKFSWATTVASTLDLIKSII